MFDLLHHLRLEQIAFAIIILETLQGGDNIERLVVLFQSLSTAFICEALLHSSFEKDLGSVAAGGCWSQGIIFAFIEI